MKRGILAANAHDVKAARSEGRDDAFIDRLALTAKAIEAMAEGLREIAKLTDPVGEVTGLTQRPSGIRVGRMRMPLGVIAIIYESRPNVTADAGALCLKSGNACILRGGVDQVQRGGRRVPRDGTQRLPDPGVDPARRYPTLRDCGS